MAFTTTTWSSITATSMSSTSCATFTASFASTGSVPSNTAYTSSVVSVALSCVTFCSLTTTDDPASRRSSRREVSGLAGDELLPLRRVLCSTRRFLRWCGVRSVTGRGGAVCVLPAGESKAWWLGRRGAVGDVGGRSLRGTLAMMVV
ncbi:hypothetical protein E2C01_034214 [Portunus trituberculatus]|uniref:Uncharacterized protein n=1 Tax=Portunus trituberculatus TaxID=210409 RepID=A0A5B7F607_PORTR|nr:hypothetical protein [Portunus trituberculatus]